VEIKKLVWALFAGTKAFDNKLDWLHFCHHGNATNGYLWLHRLSPSGKLLQPLAGVGSLYSPIYWPRAGDLFK